MIRRPRRTLPAVLVALILLAVCAAVTVSLIQRLTGNTEYLGYDSVARKLHSLAWNAPSVAGAAVVVIVLGASMLLAAVLPGRARVLPLDNAADDIDAGVDRRGLQAALRVAANSLDGVHSARVKIRRHATVTVIAHTDLHNRDGLAAKICDAVSARISEMGRPLVSVSTTLYGPGPTARDRRKDEQSRKVSRRYNAPGPDQKATADPLSPHK